MLTAARWNVDSHYMSYKSWITALQLQFFFCSVTRRRRFILTDTGAHGKQSGLGKFSASTVYHFLEGSKFTSPKPSSFEGSGTEVPVVVDR